jgi:predicted lactoylglutathione lyase
MTTQDLDKKHTVTYEPVVISLPIADRRTSYDFYRQVLSLEAVGEPDETGIPEPLQFAVNAGARVMLIPRGGFERASGGGQAAPPGQHECFLAISAATPADTDALVQRAVDFGTGLVIAPGHQPWGYVGAFADPDGHVWMVRAGT